MTQRKAERQQRRGKGTDGLVLAPVPEPAAPPAPPVRKADFLWAGQEVFQCHLGCGDRYQRFHLSEVEEHERTQHPTNLRVTGVLDANGQPLIVRVD